PLFGDGNQSRNFTYIDDVVSANLAALFKRNGESNIPFLGKAINIGGGARASLNEIIALAEELTGAKVNIQRHDAQKGDVDRTEADLTYAAKWLDYRPRTTLRLGLAMQISWLVELLKWERQTA